jgi:hypothetical protein
MQIMYAAVKGIYENGQIIITEPVPTTEKSAVIITFIGAEADVDSGSNKPREAGWLKKWGEERGLTFSIPDDFNEPLDDLKDYM